MEGLTINTIPSWVPGILMIYTGFIWLVTRKLTIRMDSRIIATTLLIWGVLYTIGSLSNDSNVNILTRLLMSRVVISLICLSQAVPMTISYFRGLRREED